MARHLCSTGHRVVITGSAAERANAVRVAVMAGLPAGAVLSTGLTELAPWSPAPGC
ncbi:hypothetical protein ACQP2E_03965 [Actinoplanes sp. CA-015351]|uniref:hypothetical protein n=1 Tax=Actinoplanes sp. CA-015351 TaxID=3239897 RepID=UPI003D979ABC